MAFERVCLWSCSIPDLILTDADWVDWLQSLISWGLIIAALDFVVVCIAVGHVVLNKRDVRAAIGWSGVIFLAPFVGSALYLMFGINRLKRRARKLLGKPAIGQATEESSATFKSSELLGELAEQFGPLAELGDKVIERPLSAGNQIDIFSSTQQAASAMLVAIERAEMSISLCTYIFDRDRIGKSFVEALRRAKERGVEVRIIVDGVGMRYSWPSIRGWLAAAKLPYAVFLPNLIPWRLHYSNLRCHRKIVVVDGRIGFTGGMNIREGMWRKLVPAQPLVDTHYYIQGPAVRDLQETFAFDWEFCTGEILAGEKWFPDVTTNSSSIAGVSQTDAQGSGSNLKAGGNAIARGIAAGPDLDSDKIRLTIAGAITTARRSVYIVTPYFLPDASLIEALNVADLRGVDVQIVLPRVNNLILVQWASTAQLWQLLRRGVQIWTSSPPFDHSKLMVVDEAWCMFGSSNWDPRSMRLNFEFNVECYSREVATATADVIRQKIAASQPITLVDIDSRPLLIKLRDGLARLATPYL